MDAPGPGDTRHFRQFCDALPEAALLVDAEGRVRHANAGAVRLFGNVCGHSCPLPGPSAQDGGDREWADGGRLYHIRRIRLTAADGSLFFLDWIRDASELAALRGQLARCQRQFSTIVENVMEGVTIAVNGKLAYVNPFMERLTGYDAATLLARPFTTFLHEEDRDGVLTNHKRRLAGQPAPPGQVFRILTRRGEARWVQAVSARIEWEDAPASLSLLSDITPQRQAQLALAELIRDQESRIASRTASLREANRTLETANERLTREIEEHERTARKLTAARKKASQASKAKSIFLANMSHEIRTPLNVILGMADLALRPDSQGQVDHVRALEMIREAGASLRALLGDLLDLSRIEAGRLDLESIPFSPSRVLDAALSGHAVLAARQGLALEGHVASDVPETLVGDPGRLGQVLANLIGNALKFTPAGRIDVFVRRGDGDKEGGCPEPEVVTLLFSVRDTGVGIDPEKRKAIFQSFRQADESITRQYGGTGLGLAICRRLVGLLGGRIRVASRPGEGSEFSFTARFALPQPGQTAPAELGAAPGAGATAGPPLPPLDILLAEDSELSAEMLLTFLVPRGHRITRVVNGRAALDALAMGRFDLVLMDIRMPVMDGLAATRAIRDGRVEGCDPNLPILALTAHGATKDRERILAAGATDYLSKPVNLDKLLAAMARMTTGKGGRASPPAAPAAKAGATPPGGAEDVPFDAGRAEALENLGGDKDLYERLVTVFLRDTPRDLERLRVALVESDTEATVLVAHTLKGNAAVVGASPASARARMLEMAARQGLTDALPGLYDPLAAAFGRALEGFAAKGLKPASS
ncbi:multi-sensor hybrid histidine kinase [Solidesulfovibrio fructosivorans JJ]]|uniref:histidine kinase n=1 Tax=Solidesulfovibrio fructosivorans JJ] TaxID=596151 RepID=E1JS30_SOLFR|nr:ATP-binding protein [Solidesulfovibrio fructosivorans]EFL52799.1 multi-sensor hybrid histidine kinase [Solidesulfovibrio fructosivorans JJ]]